MKNRVSARALSTLVACAVLGSGAAAEARSALGVAKGHVYILDAAAPPAPYRVLRFAVFGGVIDERPDSILDVPPGTLPQFTPPTISMAVAGDGSAYLYYPTQKQVLVYAPGASGSAKPIATIPVPDPSPVPGAIAVDANKYLYIPTFKSPAIVVAPNGKLAAHVTTGFVEYQGNAIQIDSAGELWLSAGADNFQLGVYATPETNPTLLRTPCPPVLFYNSLAITDDARLLMDGGTFIVVLPASTTACPAPRVWSKELSVNLYPDAALGSDPYSPPAIAVSGRDIFEVDRRERVVEYDVEGGWDQRPIAVVHWPGFHKPFAIATGP
jgi:hypothetical protein